MFADLRRRAHDLVFVDAAVRDIPRFISLYRQGRLPVDRLIDARIGFEDINEGFDRLTDGAVVRQILVPHG